MWNDEDLSIFSRDQQDDPKDLNSGGRALAAILRPYPMATTGQPLEVSFDYISKTFIYRFKHNTEISEPTIIYIPLYQYPEGCRVEISDGKFKYEADEQMLTYWHQADNLEHKIVIKPA